VCPFTVQTGVAHRQGSRDVGVTMLILQSI
jgi:hypothetical protein